MQAEVGADIQGDDTFRDCLLTAPGDCWPLLAADRPRACLNLASRILGYEVSLASVFYEGFFTLGRSAGRGELEA